jgi:hypothetical protein
VSQFPELLKSWAKTGGCLTPIALVLLLVHMGLRIKFGWTELGKGFDTAALVLIALALLPYMTDYISKLKVAGVGVKLRAAEEKIQENAEEIGELQLIIAGILTDGEAHALKMVRDGEHVFKAETYRRGLTNDLGRIRDLGMIKPLWRDGKLAELTHGAKGEWKIRDCFEMTERGEEYYKRRLGLLGAESFIVARDADSSPDTAAEREPAAGGTKS